MDFFFTTLARTVALAFAGSFLLGNGLASSESSESANIDFFAAGVADFFVDGAFDADGDARISGSLSDVSTNMFFVCFFGAGAARLGGATGFAVLTSSSVSESANSVDWPARQL